MVPPKGNESRFTPVIFMARLTVPPGVNHQIRAGRPVWAEHTQVYDDPKYKAWKATAAMELRQAGWRPLRKDRTYQFVVHYDLHCVWKRDLDGVSKALIDAAMRALDPMHVVDGKVKPTLNDNDVIKIVAYKYRVATSQQRVELTVEAWPQ